MFHVLGRIEIEDFAALTRSRVNSAQVFAPLHFPDGGDDAVFFHGLVGYLSIFSRGRRILRHVLRLCYCGLAFRHRNFDLLLIGFLDFV